MSTTTWWPSSESRETFTLPSITRYRLVDGWSWPYTIWPLRYSKMVEHGKCASGSSKGRGGAYAIVLDAIVSSKGRTAFSAGYRSAPERLLLSNRRAFNSGRAPFGIQIPRVVTSAPTDWRRLPWGSHPPPDLRRIP